ncbi:MAG: electron transport complex subunit RsxC [Gallionella sp.]|jgi:electron transport complex protein RnfC|nr:electron transport complex subunit RsxC [Gallionella sp.]MCK9353254.1 electron transport complex subunit RsxC [Gallionella sp.]
MKLFDLRGGVHPEGKKDLSAECPIRSVPLPKTLYIPLQQHIGAPAAPVVQVGDHVLKGQLIAHAQGAVSAPVHAPTSGVISALGDHAAPHPSGLPVPTFTLGSDGLDEWIALKDEDDPFALSPEDIAARVAAAGIVGLGGATFPSALKLNVSRGARTLIMNGGECEPYLTCDDRIMRERAVQIVEGIRLIAYAVGAQEVLVGIEDNKPAAIAAMQAAARGSAVKIVAMPSMYPMGSEKQIVQVLTGKEIPAGGRPADIGVLVHNVATAWAVQQAIRFGRPLISRIVTLSGGALKTPCNVEALIGTPVEELIAVAGGYAQPAARMVLGGPMMGQQFSNTNVPVVKGTSGVLALTASEIGQAEPSPCIRCSTCVRACPVGLLPLEMAAHIRASDLTGAVDLGLKDCIACGSCSYVCPAHIPLVHFFNYAKGDLAAQERAKLKQEATKKLAEARTERIARIERERTEAMAKRKAMREAKERAAKEAAAKAEAV